MGLVPAFNCLSTHVIIKLLSQLFFSLPLYFIFFLNFTNSYGGSNFFWFSKWQKYMSRDMTKLTMWLWAQRRLQISLGIRLVWSESSLCAQWGAKDPSGCPGWSESALGAHSFCWFCHVAAHMSNLQLWYLDLSQLSCSLPIPVRYLTCSLPTLSLPVISVFATCIFRYPDFFKPTSLGKH